MRALHLVCLAMSCATAAVARQRLQAPAPATSSAAAATPAAPDSGDKADAIPSPGERLNPHIRKGSEADVNAVGQRRIGGRGVGNWYSTKWEIAAGRQSAMEVEKSSRLVTDPVVVEYVNRVGQRLVKNSDAKVPFTIKVLDADEINAMALPGGYLYVNSGLILACDSEDELAGVMAHEIAHVAAHHAAREMTRMNYMQVGPIPLALIRFPREYEAEADYLGVQYAYLAGYDPRGMVTIFRRLDALQRRKPGALPRAFSGHPATPDRIAASETEIATILPPRPDHVAAATQFEAVKARLAGIQNTPGTDGQKQDGRPALQRTGANPSQVATRASGGSN